MGGCFNFRDLGGYLTEDGRTVRWRMLYRSDALHRLDSAGLKAFHELGIATVLDLRSPGEVAERRWLAPEWQGQWLSAPLLSETPDWTATDPSALALDSFVADHYLHLAEEGSAALRDSLESLARPGGLPAVFHCAAGKDRTGVLAALVLRLLGVPAQVVAEDYSLSEQATARWEQSITEGHIDDTQTAWAYVPPAMLRAERESMRQFLRYLDRDFGSIHGFTTSLGVGEATVARLRSSLLE